MSARVCTKRAVLGFERFEWGSVFLFSYCPKFIDLVCLSGRWSVQLGVLFEFCDRCCGMVMVPILLLFVVMIAVGRWTVVM